jgi:hypothetical protein
VSAIVGSLETVAGAGSLSKRMRTVADVVAIVGRNTNWARSILFVEEEVALDRVLETVGAFRFELVAL